MAFSKSKSTYNLKLSNIFDWLKLNKRICNTQKYCKIRDKSQ
nr:MAG TPA: hypothetical protein [Caudoviricetes sp.]